jgi:hypothetical protein
VTWPEEVTLNAWTGEATGHGRVAGEAERWALEQRVGALIAKLPPKPARPEDWQDPRVGWGLVLPEPAEDLPAPQRARAADAPEPIRELLAARRGPVFRYRFEAGRPVLRRYFPDGRVEDPDLASPSGTGPGELPRYLLIYATPKQVPWQLQYLLSTGPLMVGRLDLVGDGLARYVEHLLGIWNGSTTRVDQPVVWAADWGGGDITRVLRRVIAQPLVHALRGDPPIGDRLRYINGAKEEASCAALLGALAERQPALVITTSHGMTGPLEDLDAMRARLGCPVDNAHQTLDPKAVTAAWEPDGAIWYAHACCSAGSDRPSQLLRVVAPGSTARQVLGRVADLGPTVAPLPRALLGATKPLRAFVGHVEPTFDWTVQHPWTGQALTNGIRQALFHRLLQPEPLGLALQEWYGAIGGLLTAWRQAIQAFGRGEDTEEAALYFQLAAVDRQSLVILGDPTVAPPPLS